MKKVFDEIFVPSIITLSFTFVISFIDSMIGNLVNWDSFLLPITNRFCEVYQGGLIKQPVNTWSNLAYLFVGVIMLRTGIKDIRDPKYTNFIVRFPLFSILMGACCIYVFFGSFFYHASMSEISRRIDASGVVACFLLPSFYFLFRLFGLYNTKKWARFMLKRYHIFILIFILFNYFLYVVRIPHIEFSFAVIVSAVIIIVFTWRKFKNVISFNKGYFFAALSLLSIGFIMWIMDIAHIKCDPEGFMQFHSIWHILTAFSVYYGYKFYRSEKRIEDEG